ncbi:MAG: 50S ribosomal protein L15 [Alphaproteobacteria bacterium]|nr:50S ribosomal protein L15 [Alphaproteobacteria bacterium]MBP7758251.1 50S ribosomal protein L15 [Alphaproteobacteria bacterium]MBP7761606.1 50S ribosomal protein L15 [Alphaproteobacteria bacterium]MBP7904042.1 50S ribosomal protein L15 [Alphaproteobacteria bacterium]
MKLNTLKPSEGSKKVRTRLGRGIGSGKGKTSGRGVKGQKARTGVAIKGFEGGQMPLYQRMPKIGFRNTAFATKLVELTLENLQEAIDTKKLDPKKPIDEETLVKAGVVSRKRDGIKLLATGTLSAKVDLKLTKASKAAQAAVEKAGGSIELAPEKPANPKKLPKKAKK